MKNPLHAAAGRLFDLAGRSILVLQYRAQLTDQRSRACALLVSCTSSRIHPPSESDVLSAPGQQLRPDALAASALIFAPVLPFSTMG